MTEYEEISPGVWKPEQKGDYIEGVLVGKEDSKGNYESRAYAIETKDHKQILIWGCAVLDERMKYVRLGDQIKIEFDGIGKNKKGQDIKLYKVYKVKVGSAG